jgi:hypothetical protein
VRSALVLGTLRRAPAHVLRVARQPVAQQLELLEAQQAGTAGEGLFSGAARTARGRDFPAGDGGRRDVREALRHEPGKLALEPCDLRSQRASRGSLAVLDADGVPVAREG